MAAKEFRDNDKGYHRWLKHHPSGFVLNRKLPPQPYLAIHRADCAYIGRGWASNTGNPFTSKGRSKICANMLSELQHWASRETRVWPPLSCQHCRPFATAAAGHPRKSAARVPIIAVEIPAYRLGESRPLSKPSSPPTLRQLLRRTEPNVEPRQRWFEGLLKMIAAASGSLWIPWTFETSDGTRLSLDQGAVGHAMANGAILKPDDYDAQLTRVRLLQSYGADATSEAARMRRMRDVSLRREQAKFSKNIRANYAGRCAITGCTESAALEAAHILTKSGTDFNHPSNGILLRADIHALFDAHLITLSRNGRLVECSGALGDPSYRGLRSKAVWVPHVDRPGREYIADHRRRFRAKANGHNKRTTSAGTISFP